MFTSVEGSSSIHVRSERIEDTISTSGPGAVWSTSVGKNGREVGAGGSRVVGNSVRTFITFLREVQNTITTSSPETVKSASASSGSVSGVRHSEAGNWRTVVTIFVGLEATVTTFKLASTSASGSFEPGSRITGFVQISVDNTVPTVGFSAVGSADGLGHVLAGSITFLTVLIISDTITTSGELAVASASVGEVLSVDDFTLVTLLSSVRIVGLGAVVSAGALPVFTGHGRKDFGKEGVITSSTAVEENGNSGSLSSSLISGNGSVVVEVQLDFKSSISTLEGVLRRRVEFNSIKSVGLFLPSQSVLRVSWHEESILKSNKVDIKSAKVKSQLLIFTSSDGGSWNRDW